MEQNKSFNLNSKHEKQKADKTGKQKKKPKTPKKITADYLQNSGLYYLQRFAASSGHFRDVMLRKVRRSCSYHKDQDFEECAKLVDDLVDKMLEYGYLNDESYAKGMVTSLRRSGKSKRYITNHMRQKRVSMDLILKYLEAYDEQTSEDTSDAEFGAALIFARKKRLGPFQGEKEIEPDKALARLGRAGFSYETSRRVLNTEAFEAEERLHKF